MGLVSVATTAAWKTLALLGYAAIYAYVAPWHLSPMPVVHVGHRDRSASTCCTTPTTASRTGSG